MIRQPVLMKSRSLMREPRPARTSIALPALAVLAVGGFLFTLLHLGGWLQINEPLRHARAIAVLGGGQPWRSIEAASLYHAGWAPEIWLTIGTPDERDSELADIGFPPPSESDLSRKVLVKLGVPDSAIREIPKAVDNTVSELRVIAAYARSQSADPLIIVTSKVHTRRVRVIWTTVAPGQTVIVRNKPSDPFEPSRWWRTTTDALSAIREVFGILNAWAGFPIAPRER
jgi:uncharacterized SAM-binding protein YcdF (DUF218 family)